MLTEFELNPNSLRNFQQLFSQSLELEFITIEDMNQLLSFIRAGPFGENTLTMESFYHFLAAVGEVQPVLIVPNVECLLNQFKNDLDFIKNRN